MKTVVHNLKRSDFAILISVVIQELISKADYRSSIIPGIFLKHLKDLPLKDQRRFVLNLDAQVKSNQDSPDIKRWQNFLDDLVAEHQKVNPSFTLLQKPKKNLEWTYRTQITF